MKRVLIPSLVVLLLGFLAWKLQDGEPDLSPRESGAASEGTRPGDGGEVETETEAIPAVPYEEPEDDTAAPARSIRGRVETEDGTPVARAQVAAFACTPGIPIDLDSDEDRLFRAVTGSDGRFVIPVRASGRFDLVARTDTHAPAIERDVSLDEDVVITLESGLEVHGRVADLEDGPIRGARVSYRSLLAHSRFQRSTRTDMEGRFVIRGLPHAEPNASPHFFVRADGYAPRRKPIVETMEEEFVIHLSRGATVEGRVTAAGAPVDGAEVVLWTHEDPAPTTRDGVWIRNPFGSRILLRTHADAEGRYVFADVPVEIADINPLPSIRASVSHGTGFRLGGVVAWKAGFAAGSAVVRMPVREDETQVLDLILEPPARLEGRVVDLDGVPIPSVRVRPTVAGAPVTTGFGAGSALGIPGSPEPFGTWVETDAEGRWVYAHVACPGGRPTPYFVTCCACPLGLGQDQKVEVEAIPGQTVQVPDLVFGARCIRGRVQDVAGTPIEGACVQGSTQGSGSVFSGADGAFALWVRVNNGKRSADGVEVTASTYRTSTVPIPEDGSDVLVVMEPGASIKGRLVQADGSPARGIFLQAWPASAEKPKLGGLRATTDEDGRFVFGGLDPVLYVVGTHPMSKQPFETRAQADGPEIEGVLPPPSGPEAYAFAVKVLRSSDRSPISRAQAHMRDVDERPHMSGRSALPRAPGLYEFVEVPAGTHTMTVSAMGFAPVTHQVTVGPDQMEPLEILLGAGAQLSGRVSFPPGIEERINTTVTVLTEDGRTELGKADVAPDGTYSLAGIPKGPILVRAEAPGLGRDFSTRPPLTVARMIPLVAGDVPLVRDLDLVPAARLELTFSSGSGDAGPRPVFAFTPSGTGSAQATVADAAGRPWQTIGLHAKRTTKRTLYLPPGRYTVEVRRGDAVLSTTPMTAPGDRTVTIPDP